MTKTAADIMEKNVITAKKDTTIFDLVDMFVKHNITAIPVVDDDNAVIGIVTDADLLYKEVKPHVPQYVNLLGANIYYGNLKKYGWIQKTLCLYSRTAHDPESRHGRTGCIHGRPGQRHGRRTPESHPYRQGQEAPGHGRTKEHPQTTL